MLKIILLITFISLSSYAGQDGGSGGDGIICKPSSENFLNGTYSLDYILTLSDAKMDTDTVQVQSWEESADRLEKILKTKIPSLASYFEEFRKSAFNTKDYSQTRIWEPAPFGIVDIKDENITSQIPSNCKENGETKVIQAVIREHESFSGTKDHIIYKYMPDVVNELNKTNPLQLSYLMVHEWLWDFSSNVERNRRINRFLHSKKIEDMSGEEIEANLKGMGLFLPGIEPEIFENTSCQGNLITKKEFFERTDKNFKKLGDIEFKSRSRIISCAKGHEDCSKTWRAPGNAVFDRFPFFVVIAWDNTDPLKPIKIVSPNLLSHNGENYTHSSAQISCSILDNKEYNLECTIHDENLARSFTGNYMESSSLPAPVLRGVFTDECLRIENKSIIEISGMAPPGVRVETHEYQNLLFSRYKWNK